MPLMGTAFVCGFASEIVPTYGVHESSAASATRRELSASWSNPPPITRKGNPTAVDPQASSAGHGTVRVNSDLKEYYSIKAIDPKTKNAKYMTKDEAEREGYHPPHSP